MGVGFVAVGIAVWVAPPIWPQQSKKICGKLDWLQTQNEKIINLTQKRLKRDFSPFL